MSLTLYEYFVIRYVPNTVREEFVNVGVIAGHRNDWEIRSNLTRAGLLGGEATAAARLIDNFTAMTLTREYLMQIRHSLNNSAQISAPRPVLASSTHEAADLAYDTMIGD